MKHAPRLSDLTQSSTWGELLLERRDSRQDPIRFVQDVRPGFCQREEASELVHRSEQVREAAAAAGHLAAAGVRPGDRVLLQLPNPRDFVVHFFACQLLGAVAVPVVPPWSLAKMEEQLRRLLEIAAVARPRVTLVDDRVLAPLRAFLSKPQREQLGRFVSPEHSRSGPPLEAAERVSASEVAMVQFTSGSTADPRGVALTHENLLQNCYAIGAQLGFFGRPHLGCSWLPLFHDMGLIGHALVPLLWQIPTVLMPPEAFAMRPASWLQAISGYGATISTAPNFAYQLASSRLSDEQVRELDLSRWDVALCGGEAVLASTLDAFYGRFSSVGFKRRALCPVYGLAEATLAVTFSSPGEEPRVHHVDRTRFAEAGVAQSTHEPESMDVVSCGQAAPAHEVSIQDGNGEFVQERQEGEICVRGPSVMRGYLGDPDATRGTFRGTWLRTGDRGYLADGELFITGRDKELIVKGGRNYYPHELEAAAARVEGVRAGRVAAFGIRAKEGTERLVIAAECRQGVSPESLERPIIEAVARAVGTRPDHVEVLPPGTLTKTSSGKMRRIDAAERYLAKQLRKDPVRGSDAARLLLARARIRLSRRA